MLTKEEMPACPVATTVRLIGSKWKLLIMRNLLQRSWRFNELRKDLEGISQIRISELKTKKLVIRLEPETQSLGEVVVTAKYSTTSDKMCIFRCETLSLHHEKCPR